MSNNCYTVGKTIFATVRFLIGFRWDGRMFKLDPKELGGNIKNPAQYCIDRGWTKIEGVGRNWYRFVVYHNPYPVIVGYGSLPKPDPGPTPEWELERAKKAAEYNSPEAIAARAAKKAAKEAEAAKLAEEYW